MNSSPSKPLRILSLLNLDWNPHFGAARVYVELIEQWRAHGHTVEHFSFSEAFPNRQVSPREYAMRRLTFPKKAADFVKANANRFDVVDALIGSLSTSKRNLGFSGLLVARSVGSHRLYDQFERSVDVRWPGHKIGTFAGKLFYSGLNRWYMAECDAALRHADLINVANIEEADFLRHNCRINRPVIVEAYGLTSENRDALSSAGASPADKLKQKKVSFVGMWGPRKGARVWGEIIRRVRERVPEAQFSFLGTMAAPEAVLKDLGEMSSRGVTSVPEYRPEQLPKLLSDCAVGAFPSYVEGFGLAVIEQLAAGIPTVAFDQGGPRDILRETLPDLLIPVDDVKGLADALIRILSLSLTEYEQLIQASVKIASRYSWSDIARDTLDKYRSTLAPRDVATESPAH